MHLLASSSYSHLAFCYENPTADVKLKISFGNPDKQYGYRSNWVKIKRVRKQKSQNANAEAKRIVIARSRFCHFQIISQE
jgi:hypothetical protein